jgi:hypothetical protein
MSLPRLVDWERPLFQLSDVVPWGRSFEEYRRMFALAESDLSGRILGCADGPASFNAEATARGHRVTSCDPIYQFSRLEIQNRIRDTYSTIMDQTRANAGEFVWDTIRSIDELGQVRMKAMNTFLADYDAGRYDNRYVAAQLPILPFENFQFDLAICSHFLFLYSKQLDVAFHRDAVRELSRVAREIRIFPLVALGGSPSEHVGAAVSVAQELGCVTELVPVPYEFQKGANRMLRIAHQ